MNFEKALTALKKGQKLRRAAWGDNALWLEMKTPEPAEGQAPESFFELMTATGPTPWLSGTIGDLLGEDWALVKD